MLGIVHKGILSWEFIEFCIKGFLGFCKACAIAAWHYVVDALSSLDDLYPTEEQEVNGNAR